jgi:predicted MFS family arabinose efflux permease
MSLPFFLLVPDRRPTGDRPAMALRDLGEGFRTAVRERELRLLIGLAAALFLTITAFWALEPVFVRHTLHRGGDALSFLWAAHGVGAFLGAVAVSRIRTGTRRELLLVGAGVAALGAGEIAYAGAGLYGVALLGAVFMGMGLSFYFAPAMALIQRVAPEWQRGRVTSVFGVLQETVGLTASITVAAVGLAVGTVRPALVGGGIFVAAAGLAGVRAFVRLRRRMRAAGQGDGEPREAGPDGDRRPEVAGREPQAG